MTFSRKAASSMTALGLILTLTATAWGGQANVAPRDLQATDANITRTTTELLEQSQFAHHPFDRELASRFLDGYLDSLDPARSLFLQSDVDEFAAYRANLAEETRGPGDTSAARTIFARYLQRLAQQTSCVTDALRSATFDFTGHDVYSFDRAHAQRPSDLAAAQALWRQQLRVEFLQEKLADKAPGAIIETLTHRHNQQLETMKSLGDDEVLDVYLNALAHVYDPHSDYLGREQMESFSIAMNLSLFGIGATLESTDGYCKIRELMPGGPAAKSGLLKPGDRIVAVSQTGQGPVEITNMPISRAVVLIRGPKGSTVTLTILPSAAPEGSPTKTVTLVRAEVKLEDQAARARILDLATPAGTRRLGVIELPSFYADLDGPGGRARRSATADVARLLGKLKAEHVRGVVLDLRRNGGGSLAEAISLTGLFIRKGPVVQTRDLAGDIAIGEDADPSVIYDGPLVVLTSRFSASASEILAGALQDYGRALVVGDPSTFGKGTVQTIVPLAPIMDGTGLRHAFDPGALKVTTNKFYRPSGASTQLRGVVSDIVLPSVTDLSDVSESALKDPLPWDTVASTAHESLNRVAPYVAVLREQSARRVTADRDFGFVTGDLARLRKSVALKSVSLNEAERRHELAEAKARHEEREREDRVLHAKGPTIYEITLANASSSGLPPPDAFDKDPQTTSREPAASAAENLDEPSSRPASDDFLLNETVRILADYVDLARGHASRDAGARTSNRASRSAT
jgi:carboxyl-terminal processing protease